MCAKFTELRCRSAARFRYKASLWHAERVDEAVDGGVY